jgi:hypothetical protein
VSFDKVVGQYICAGFARLFGKVRVSNAVKGVKVYSGVLRLTFLELVRRLVSECKESLFIAIEGWLDL